MQTKTTFIIKVLLPWLLISIACQTLLPEEPTATVEKPTRTPRAATETPTSTQDDVATILSLAATLTALAPEVRSPTPLLDEPTAAPAFNWDVEMDPPTHVADGTEVKYNTNPPSSGPHYGQPLPAGFYAEGDVVVDHPESHIIHSLEHGYVAIWYNCDVLDEAACDELIAEIVGVLNEFGASKVIIFPWHDMDATLAMTSWGQWVLLEEFDAELVAIFVVENRSNPRAPEPNVP